MSVREILETREPCRTYDRRDLKEAYKIFCELEKAGERPLYFAGFRMTPLYTVSDKLRAAVMTWEKFLELSKRRSPAGVFDFTDHGKASEKEAAGGWAESYDAWLDHAANGDKERGAAIVKALKTEAPSSKRRLRRFMSEDDGDLDVPRVIEGHDLYLEDRKRSGDYVKGGGNTIRMCVEITHYSGASDEAMQNRGVAIARAVAGLEAEGYSVILDMTQSNPTDSKGVGYIFVIQSVPTTATVLATAIANPATFRRGGFSMIEWAGPETCHRFRMHTNNGYGSFTQETFDAWVEHVGEYDVVLENYIDVDELYGTEEEAEERTREMIKQAKESKHGTDEVPA